MLNIFVSLSNFLYRMKCKYWSKYSTVKPSSLRDDVFHSKQKLLVHSIFQILSDSKLNKDDLELLRIKYWWSCIFLPKSNKIINQAENKLNNTKRFKRLLNQSNQIIEDLDNNIKYILNNRERLM